MLLHGGLLAGDQIVGPGAVALMTSDALGMTVELYGSGHCGSYAARRGGGARFQ